MNSLNLEKRVENSRFSITKNFLYFLIAPLVILIVGAIILSTVGYNLGYDFTGGTTFRMFVNKDNEIITTTDNYDLEKGEDFTKVYNKVVAILNKNDASIVAITKTGISVEEYHIVDGQAIEVTYQNNLTDKDEIILQNQTIRSAIIDAFGLDSYEGTVGDFDVVAQKATSTWITALVCSAIVAFVAGIIYIMARYGTSASLVGIMLLAFDVFGFLSLVLICRVPVNMTLGGVILATTLISLCNLLAFYSKVKSGYKAGMFEKLQKSEMADKVVKQQTFVKSMIYLFIAILMIIWVAFGVNEVRFIALSMIFALAMTYYNSQFIMPSLFAVFYKKKKKKIAQK